MFTYLFELLAKLFCEIGCESIYSMFMSMRKIDSLISDFCDQLIPSGKVNIFITFRLQDYKKLSYHYNGSENVKVVLCALILNNIRTRRKREHSSKTSR